MGMTYTRTKLMALITTAFICLPQFAVANCYVDYKAKQSNDNLRLHYGVMQLPLMACNNKKRANAIVTRRLEKDGWQLLRVLSVFGEDELSTRQVDAGDYFLKY